MQTVHFITETLPGEPDILHDVKHSDLEYRGLYGRLLSTTQAPECGWNHTLLTSQIPPEIPAGEGIDAFLGDMWIGSTEV